MTPAADRGTRKLRLFYALWPGDGERARLAEAAQPAVAQVDGQPVPPGNFHVTLAFLGMVRSATLAPLIVIGGHGPWPTVGLEFRRTEYWARPKVLVAVASAVPETGRQIVERLWQELEPLGFARETRPWQPHLTLARRIRRPPAPDRGMPPFGLAMDAPAWRLALVESTAHPDGARYKPVADWPLE